jgi:predicted NACHT family NTPase
LYGSTLGSGASASLSGEISALAFFPNGQTLATGGQDGTLRFWDVSLREPILEFPAHSAWVWGLAASPAGDRLATASADRTIKLWEVRAQPNGEPGASFVRSLTGHTETVWGVDFAPDGRTLASASWDGTVRLWDVNSGEQLAVLEGHSDWVYDVAYSPAGGLLASSSARSGYGMRRPGSCWPRWRGLGAASGAWTSPRMGGSWSAPRMEAK